MKTQHTPGPQDHGFSIWQPQIDRLLLVNSELRAERDAARLASMLGSNENGAVIACYIADLVDERDKLRSQNARLAEALKSACRYLDKAEADGLMQGCAVRPQTAATKYRTLLAEIAAQEGKS